MQRNHPNRAFFFYFITSFSKPDFLFPFAPPFLRSPHQSSLSPAFPSVSLFFFPLTLSYPLTGSLRPPLVGSLFSRDNATFFNRVALSLARDPPVPSCSAVAPLFQFLRLSYPSLPFSVSAALYSHPVLPSPTAWRVIPRKPWYFVGHGVQSHGGPDEA